MTEVPLITLHDGVTIPQLGFGTFKVSDAAVAEAVSEALRVGYRHIDTAEVYGNERGVGKALAASGLAREDYFVTTKVWNDHHHADKARIAITASLERLGLDYLDLYLIHWPSTVLYGDSYVQTWEAMQEFKREGLTRSIGVSNFNPEHLDKLTGAIPVVNQIELHPSLGQAALCIDAARRGIAIEAWSPLARGEDLSESTVIRVADDLDRTPAQVIIRWHLQLGHIVIPKSVTAARIAENFKVFDFELSENQMAAITALDRGDRIGTDPATATF